MYNTHIYFLITAERALDNNDYRGYTSKSDSLILGFL